MTDNNNNIHNIFQQTNTAQQFVESKTYNQSLQTLAERISDHYHYITDNVLPICLKHVSVNEQIVLAISNKFGVHKQQVTDDLDPFITPLLTRTP